MLAASGTPFDSVDHLFEFKWDGFRTMAHVEHGSLRLMSRGGRDVTAKYPELAPSGIGFPTAASSTARSSPCVRTACPTSSRCSRAIRRAMHGEPRRWRPGSRCGSSPSTCCTGTSNRSWRSRCASAVSCLLHLDAPKPMAISEAIPAEGRRLYRTACSNGLEGIVGKRLDSTYRPGRRSDAWTKVKRRLRGLCAIVGFLPQEAGDIQSVVVAMDRDGVLTYAGRVGTGYGEDERLRLAGLAAASGCPNSRWWRCRPARSACGPASTARSASWTRHVLGVLRAPVFERLIEEA